jgi:ABC-2 type transport system permease protein
MTMRKILSLMEADLKMWFRQPKLIIMSIAPLLIISIFAGFFLAKAEILPVAIVAEDNDPAAIRLKDYLINLRSGSGVTWFHAEEETGDAAREKFKSGKSLGLITIPANLSERLRSGEPVVIPIIINNINDDVTKNFIQRMQYAFNYFNEGLTVNSTEYHIPRVNFVADTAPDLPMLKYICASILGLAMLMSVSLAVVFSVAREFEDGTMKELVMTPRLSSILGGKLLSAIFQGAIVTAFILLEEWLIFGFSPSNIPSQILYFLWGVLFSAGMAAIAAALMKQILPAGILIMVINIGGWWVSGGLAPSEAWTGLLRTLADYWPGTYFYQVYINTSLLGGVSGDLVLRNVLITGIFGAVMLAFAYAVFVKEAREV